MNHVLLLGAGFTRNWGGWLASEAFEYLLGCPELDDSLRNLLWEYRERGGFEAALAQLQKKHIQNNRTDLEPRLANLQKAILQMFADMDAAFRNSGFIFEFSNDREYLVREFLTRFDAVFTLNQDTLLEQHYLNGNIELSSKWNGWQLPGMKRLDITNPSRIERWGQNTGHFQVDRSVQPIFKLHGSTNWDDPKGEGLLVLGGNKSESIDRYPILSWYFEQFRDYLSRADTRMMVIGYGFGDDHINNALLSAADSSNLRLFIVDELGVDVLDKNIGALIPHSDILTRKLWPKVMGSSRRRLSEIFHPMHQIEHGKLMRFFAET